MKADELRQLFIEFFSKDKKHTLVKSAPLVPIGDPTLLFTSAGMVQFKKLWTGEVPLPYTRAVSVQKCIRASDLDEVGKTTKHITFFEMLGNFSFGDYFKEEAINWAWEFLTKILKLEEKNLYVSVLDEDNEAYKIWQNIIPQNKIYKLGKKDNFWGPVGGTGACGPCSEIYYDLGKEIGCGKPNCQPGCDCDRFVEIWNLVFPTFDAQPDGKLKPLKNRGIDTGMGLERLLMAIEGKKSVFLTSIFAPIINEIINTTGVEKNNNINIIADHIRTLTFAIAEGVYPSNTGRGYVLRHILRRAQMAGYELGVKKPFIYKLPPIVAETMKTAYPEITIHRETISLIIKAEEESFLKTIEQGTKVFNELLHKVKGKKLSGEAIFKLYDTYGFPPELTKELAKRKGLEIDIDRFNKIMEEAKERSRAYSKFSEVGKPNWNEFSQCDKTEFVGYHELKTEAKIMKWRSINSGYFELILDKSPFYGERGGQVGDTGKIYNKDVEFDVCNTQVMDEFLIHICKLNKGEIASLPSAMRNTVICEVDKERRMAIARNHTATHLLHSALRKILGNWVHQQGSLVEPQKLRFDFTHFAPLSKEEIRKVEQLVNTWIMENIPVKTWTTDFDTAIKKGAIAIFGEKYGDRVRVVEIDDVSIELCGGTHTKTTAQVGMLKITHESAIHTGIRRIEAITGTYAIDWLNYCESILFDIGEKISTPINKIKDKIDELIENEKRLKDKLNSIELNQIFSCIPEIIANKKIINKINILAHKVNTDNINNLRILADKLRKEKKTVGVIGCVSKNKPIFITFTSDDLTSKIRASDIAKEIGKLVDGGGGGKDTIGEAGGKNLQKLDEIINTFPNIIKSLIQNVA